MRRPYSRAFQHMVEHSLLEIGFRPLLDAAPDATVVVDRRGSVVALNHDVESLFGWPEPELLGQPMNRLIPARFHRVLEHMLEIPLNHESPAARPKGVRVSLFARRKDGTELPVHLKALAVDFLKIGGHYVRGVIDDPVYGTIVSAVNEIGALMGIAIIAEEVDSEPILDRLRNLGIGYAQGHAVAVPEPLADAEGEVVALPCIQQSM